MDTPYLYLILDLLTLSFPFLASFESRISYYKSFSELFSAIAVGAFIFILWDMAFTDMGIWGFNERYLTGYQIGNLPVEEILFFIFIPFSSIFIFRSVDYYFTSDPFYQIGPRITEFMAYFTLAIGLAQYEKWYTATTFIGLSVLLFAHRYWLKTYWMSKFWLAYLFILIPFFLVNGVLTGTGIEDQIVWYNDNENLGLRLFTIPLEDAFYGMFLILLDLTIYDILLKKSRNSYQLSTTPRHE